MAKPEWWVRASMVVAIPGLVFMIVGLVRDDELLRTIGLLLGSPLLVMGATITLVMVVLSVAQWAR